MGLTPTTLPALVTIALAHVELETIHPFRDGNGRIGRLMISLWLCARGLLTEPLLDVSVQLKKQRREYDDRRSPSGRAQRRRLGRVGSHLAILSEGAEPIPK
jgi:Fic family protein